MSAASSTCSANSTYPPVEVDTTISRQHNIAVQLAILDRELDEWLRGQRSSVSRWSVTSVPNSKSARCAAELTSVDSHRFQLAERDSNGDGLPAPRLKKIFILDTNGAAGRNGYVDKQPLADLMAIPDPNKIGGDGDFFRFPFNTIESVHVVNDHTIIVANDNNYPFSNGRARSRTNDRTGPLTPDENEFILVDLAASLHPDARLLCPS